MSILAQNGITYHGGRVMVGGPNVYVIFYGAGWNSGNEVTFRGFLSNLTGSGWFASANTYYDASGTHIADIVTYSGEFVDSTYSQGTGTLPGTAIPLIVQNAITHAGWPVDTAGIYVVLLDNAVTTVLGPAWHGAMASGSDTIQFSVSPLSGSTTLLSHEFIEATTDPTSAGWFDAGGLEVADKCGQGATITLNGVNYQVEKYWVNASGGFCSAGSTPPPVAFYIDPAGSDSNNGTSTSTPWRTVAKVNSSTFTAGQTVSFKAGGVWRESLIIPSSGTIGNPITFTRYGVGANPQLDGSVIETGWTLDAGSVYKKTPPLGLANQVFQDGARLARAASHGAIVAGSYFYDSGTTTLYVQMTNSSNPSGHTVEDDSISSLINFNGKSWINVTSIDTIGSHNNGYDFQQVAGAHDINVAGATSSFNFIRGFSMGGFTVLGTSNIAFNNCVSHDNLDEAFWIGNGTNNGCTNCEAYNNGKDVSNGYTTSLGGGILVGTGAVNNYVLKSYIHDTYFNFPLMEEDQNHAGRVKPTGSLMSYNYILNNAAALTTSVELEGSAGAFAYNWIVTTASGAGKSIRMHSQGGVATPSTNELVIGNSIYQGVTASSTVFNPEATTVNFTFENNKVVFATTGGSAGDAISWASGATGTSDYNSFQNTEFFWGATSSFPATLAAWKTACSCDAHSVLGSAAGYTSTVSPFNLDLTAGAPEIDAGLNLGTTYQFGLDPVSVWPSAIYTQNQNSFGTGWEIGSVVYTAISQFYVDPAGSDSNNGTSITTPWQTVAKVNSVTFTPGQTINFKSGGVWHEALSASHSGTASQPITYTFYGSGVSPIFDGADVQSTWTLEVVSGHNLYHSNTGTYPSDPTQVFQIDGLVTTRLTRAASTAAMGTGSWFYDVTNTRVYVRTTTDDAPSNHVMEVSARTLGASTTSSIITNVVMNGLHATRTQHIGLSATTVINSQADYNYDFGIVAPYNNSLIQNNTVSQNGSSGISSFGTFTNFSITATTSYANCQLAEEANQDFCAGIRFGGSGIGNGSVTNNESYANVLGGASSGRGIHFDTNAASGSTVTISGNKVHNNYSIGIIIEQAHNTSVQYNVAYSNGISPGDAGIEIFRSTGPNTASGNVSWGNAIGYRSEGTTAGTQTNNAFTNNIGLNNSVRELTAKFGGENDGVDGSGNTYTYNSFGVQAANFIEWGSGVFKSTYAAFDTAYGSATHSITTDPLLVNPPTDFSLQTGSPAIDSGFNLGAGYQFGLDSHSSWTANVYTQNQNSYGTGWDVGAYVYTSTSQCAIAITAPSSGTVTGPTTLSASSTSCPSVVRFEWKINGQPLMGDGTFEYSATVPTCTLGTCSGSYQMPAGFGAYNVSYNWDGVYPLTVQALDSTGAVLATSATVNLTITDYALGGTCSLSAPNFASPQSGTISVTVTCPGISGTGVFANAWYALYIDGKFLSRFAATAYPDHTFSFDTTTLENGKHLMWVSVTATKVAGSDNQNDIGNSPVFGAWGQMTTANGSSARELRLNFNKCFLWLGGTSTCSLSARTANDDNTEAATNATFTTSDATVATVGSCTSVASCTITGVGSGVAQITATGTNGLVETAYVTVNSGTPIMPHFGTDGSYCTAYNTGNCSPNKSFLVRMMFDNADTTNSNTTLRTKEVLAGYNVFQHSVYPNPAYNSYPSFSSWQTLSHQYFTGAAGINAILASGFKAFMPSCASMFQDGQSGQSSSDGNGAVSDGRGFLARMAYLMTDMQGKSVGCLSPDEDPLPLIKGFGTGQMGTVNGPSQIVVSGGTATVTWPAASGTQYHIDITGATNVCLNGTNITTSGGIGGPFTFSNGCASGTYNSGTDPNLVISIYNELCPNHPCQTYPPLNIPIPNSILQTIQTGLHAATPPAAMGFSWAGGAPKSIYQISASVADYTDIYFTWITSENWSLNRGYPSGRTVRMPLLAIENQFWNQAWPGMDRTKPFYQLTHTGDGSWFARGGKTFTLGATTGSQFTTTVANNAVIGSKITVSGATCTGNYFDVLSIQSSQTFTVTQSPACSGSGGTVVIAPVVNYFLPKLDQYKQPPIRGVENAAQLWLAYALGAAGNRTFQLALTSGGVQYPCTASNAYVDNNCPPNAPNLEDDNTGNTYIFTDNPGATARWNSNSFTQNLIEALTPEIVQPLCNAPDLGQRIHTGAKCGALGKLVIAISDSELPTTVNFPATLWSLFNVGSASVTRLQQVKGAYVNITNISGSATSDTFTAQGGEIDIWWFPAGSTALGQTYSLPFTLPAGATQTAFRSSYLCDPTTLTSNLDQNPNWTIGTSIVNTVLVPTGAICYQTQFLDPSNVPVGAPSAVQVLTSAPVIITTSPLPSGLVSIAYTTTLVAAGTTPIIWAVTSGTLPAGLTLNPSTGVISGTPTALGTSNFTVSATNSSGTNSKPFVLSIGSNPPLITTTSPLPDATVNVAYTTTLAASGTTPITWSLATGSSLPSGLSLAGSTGIISGTPIVSGAFSFTVVATNVVGNNQKLFSLTVDAPPVITTTSPLPSGTINVAYSTTVAATGTAPITWAVTIGTLPTGLSLNSSTGVISGTPTGTGTSSFTVTATNSFGQNAVAFSLTIAGTAPAITTATPLPAATVNVAYTTILAATGTTPITWSVISGALPTGITLNASTGVISGTPTVAGNVSFTIQAQNSFGINSKAFTVAVNGTAPVITTTSPLPAGMVNIPYSQTLAATGTTPITWTITVGSLPAGLSLGSTTGTISGTPTTSGTSAFTATATNSFGTNSKAFSITIGGTAPVITSTSPLANGVLAVAYNVTLTASGSTPLTWSITNGTLPTGLSLNTSTGAITGTPTVVGNSSFKIQVTNSVGSNSKQFRITVTGVPPTITTATPLPQATQGTAYTTTISATGSTPITWSIVAGTLPTGLTLHSTTGVIDGTPTGTGTSSFTVLATNGAGTFAKAFSLTVIPTNVAPTITTTSPLPQANQNVFYSVALIATGTTPITWSVTVGSLPTGLSLDTNSGLISGTPTTVATSNFTVQASNIAGTNSKALSITVVVGSGTRFAGSAVLAGKAVIH